MLTKTLIAATALATLVIATMPAYSSTTVFGDRLPAGLAAAITGNFITPEPFRPNSALLRGMPVDDAARPDQAREAAQKVLRAG